MLVFQQPDMPKPENIVKLEEAMLAIDDNGGTIKDRTTTSIQQVFETNPDLFSGILSVSKYNATMSNEHLPLPGTFFEFEIEPDVFFLSAADIFTSPCSFMPHLTKKSFCYILFTMYNNNYYLPENEIPRGKVITKMDRIESIWRKSIHNKLQKIDPNFGYMYTDEMMYQCLSVDLSIPDGPTSVPNFILVYHDDDIPKDEKIKIIDRLTKAGIVDLMRGLRSLPHEAINRISFLWKLEILPYINKARSFQDLLVDIPMIFSSDLFGSTLLPNRYAKCWKYIL